VKLVKAVQEGSVFILQACKGLRHGQ